MKISACGASHRGNIRSHNEDNIYVDGVFRNDLSVDNYLIRSQRRSLPCVYAVFDGLGGEACGEQASLIAALGLKAMDDREATADIETYISAAHKAIINEASRKDADNMGTTVAALLTDGDTATVFNVGDSRVYLYRNGVLTQLSRDHSVVQALIDSGLIGEEDRSTSKYAGELTQYVGMVSEEDIEPSAYETTINVESGDIFLLCSDGLTGEMSDIQIREFFDTIDNKDPEHLVTQLIKRAVKGDCRDNVSVIVGTLS